MPLANDIKTLRPTVAALLPEAFADTQSVHFGSPDQL